MIDVSIVAKVHLSCNSTK